LPSGTVPVYLGDARHLNALLPHPKAAIFVADFNNNYTQLADYLTYLSNNETAYESHREWRKDFSYEDNIKNKPLLQSSWYCDVCRWAVAHPQLCQAKEERLKNCAPAS
jgi:Glycosyltransferase family 10 (fucosyltransferase) C-term